MTGPVNIQEAVRLNDLTVAFSGRPVLRNLNLSFEADTLSVVIGRSGSGKTTLLRALNRLNECFPGCETSGSVMLRLNDGVQNIYNRRVPLAELRRRVGMLFQSPNVLRMGIFRNVALPLKLSAGLKKRDIPDRVEAALIQAHLWDEVKDRLNDHASTLSGGQQQRLCLARVLALEPDILLLDEPTASLDFRAAEKIEELLLELKKRYTIIAVSHSLSQAKRLADYVVVVKDGKAAQKLPESIFSEHSVLNDLLGEIF